ncbi:hypothetical protein OAH70_05950 [Flavobacteriaceae bacterium]|jgi:hypothetical protein|nr:hypothetical protein [Flavobacteriaceae bacterium]MDC0506368.1 hypothetical protein [Flavobacteriaceae bacterium]|tara:strand:+ start:75 stop:353 length:279 start_codon:yes stop_codon:yes gene_type:complete
MPFTKETASRAGKKSKRGKDLLDSELKEKLKLRFLDILESIDKKELTSTEKLKYLQLSINYIIPKAIDKKIDDQQPIQSIMWIPASEKDLSA